MAVLTGSQDEELVTEDDYDDNYVAHVHTTSSGRECVILLPIDTDEQEVYSCEFCGVTYSTVDLDEGYSYSFNVTEEVYVCHECPFTHEDETQTKRHYTIEHGDND